MVQDHRQPKGFVTFFLTEMWERYGFYIIQTLLIFYLVNKLHLNDNQAYVVVGSFTALAYINCIFGGLLADKLIGYNNTVILGGVALFIGYSTLGLAYSLSSLSIGLAFISVGTGCFKPNISSMLNLIYTVGDKRRQAGYTLYYVGIYVGALGGSLAGGELSKRFGVNYTTITAAIGALLAIAVFIYGSKKHKIVDRRHLKISLFSKVKAVIIIAALTLISYHVLTSEFLSTLYFILIAVFCFGFILYCIATHHGVQKYKLIAFLFLVILAVLYWAIYFQQFFSISLCTERVFQLPIPYSSAPAIESLGVIIFGPLINWVWFKFQDKGKEISIPTKFSFGFLFNSICFLLLAFGLWYSNKNNVYLNFSFIIVAYLLISIGELCLSPTSLAMVPALVPEHLTSAMMGISLLSIGFGGKLAGMLASNAALNKLEHSLLVIRQTYMLSFFNYFLISIATYVVVLLLIKHINKLIKSQS